MKRETWKKYLRTCLLVILLSGICAVLPSMARETQAATTGFKTVNGKTYYIKSDGSNAKGLLTINGKTYYFDEKTGVQLKGWQKDSAGKKIRYFTTGKGIMVTGFLKDSSGNVRYFDTETGLMVRGWMTDSSGYKYYFSKGSGIMAKGWLKDTAGNIRYFSKANGRMLTGWQTTTAGVTRYFNKSTGIMYKGLKKIGSYYYYFSKSNGARYQKGWLTVSGKKYYFALSNGRAKTGWMTLNGKKYYFSSAGELFVSTSALIDGVNYIFDSNGVASKSNDIVVDNNVKVYDSGNNKYYYMAKEYIADSGVASKEVSDRDLLAALVDSEAGDQGLIGMEAVALCVLNRTLDPEFPSEVRFVIYQALHQGSSLAQYSVIKNGSFQKRLNGQFSSKTNAYKAVDAALKMIDDYVKKGTKRKLSGFKKDDFDYKYFMMEASFWSQSLNFDKVDKYLYKDHMFFVDWISA